MSGDAGDEAVGPLIKVAQHNAEQNQRDRRDAVADVGEAEDEAADQDRRPAVREVGDPAVRGAGGVWRFGFEPEVRRFVEFGRGVQ